jgi:hypothetical protein
MRRIIILIKEARQNLLNPQTASAPSLNFIIKNVRKHRTASPLRAVLPRVLLVALIAFVATTVTPATAVDQAAAKKGGVPWTKPCSEYSSAKHFVSESSLYCLRQSNQRACHERAQEFFEGCRFSGDYQRISKRVHAKMLIVLALTGTNQQGYDEPL